MNERRKTSFIKNKRLLSWEEAQEYCGLGRSSVRKYAEGIGAIKHYGRRVLFDRVIIDKNMEDLSFWN